MIHVAFYVPSDYGLVHRIPGHQASEQFVLVLLGGLVRVEVEN